MKLVLFLVLYTPAILFAQEIYTSYWESKIAKIETDWEKTPADIFILKNDDNYLFDSMKGEIIALILIDNKGKHKYDGIYRMEVSDSTNIICYKRNREIPIPGYLDYFNKKIEEKLKDLHLRIEIYDLQENHYALLRFAFKYN